MQRNTCFWLIASLFFSLQLAAQPTTTGNPAKLDWFLNDKFGLFLHWGLYSQAGGFWKGKPYKGNEHFMLYERIPWKEYRDSLAKKLNPVKFNAEEWVKLAKKAGMKYIVVTAKHHDGFAMFRSPSSNYDIVNETPYGKDPMKALAKACKKQGIKLCFYYSLGRDWQDPDVPTNWPTKAGRSNTWDYPNEEAKDLQKYVERKVLPQLKELLTQYGPVSIIWFDTPELITKTQSQHIKEFIHQQQPRCIVNNRIGNGMGDYAVREQTIGAGDSRPWESCVTMSSGWGYNRLDTLWKSPELLVRQLTEVVSKGGNYLLNIGPQPNGVFPEKAVARLKQIGQWMKENGEAVYGTQRWVPDGEADSSLMKTTAVQTLDHTMPDVINDTTSKRIFPEIRFTKKGDAVYVFVNSYTAPFAQIQSLAANKGVRIKQITDLSTRKKVQFTSNQNFIEIPLQTLPKTKINVRVFKVEIEK